MHERAHRRAAALFAPLAGLLAVSCAAGPNFKRPAPPPVAQYSARPVEATTSAPGVAAGEAQRFVEAGDIPGDWWTLFHSQTLDDLIKEALAHNHDLKAAHAALKVARENTLAQRAAYFPTLTGGLSATHQHTSGALAPIPSTNASDFSLYTAQVAVSYAPDVFGLNRRTVESLKAQEDETRYEMIAADLTISTNVANAVIQLASTEAQIEAVREQIGIEKKLVEALKYQNVKGFSSGVDLAAQEAQLAQTEAALPDLLKQRDQQRDLLAVLCGRYPSQAPQDAFQLSGLTLPQDLPLSLPSTLVAQRPDVLQAEANMHSASAQIGVAVANRLPSIQLTGDSGTTALTLGGLFGPGTGFWDLGAAATQTLFDAGALKHRENAARAAYTQSLEQYRSTVLGALQNVADTLAALEHDAEAVKAQAKATDAAKVTLDLSERQWKEGYASYLTVLNAEQAYQQARIGLVQAQASRFSDTVALYQALGGGWWRRADLTKKGAS
jgi:NodT family efflux transporter outer membrane factor (OMF) lipoprotein